MKYANDLENLRQSVAPAPLTAQELKEFFCETSDSRDPSLVRRDELYNYFKGNDPAKVLLIGHAGAGKSTELVKFQQEHSERFEYVSFFLTKEAQLSVVSTEVLLVLIVEAVVRTLHESLGVSLDEKTLKAVSDWFAVTMEIKEDDLKYTGQIGGEAGSKSSILSKFLGVCGYIKADIRAGAQKLHRTTQTQEKRLPALVHQCNLIIREAQLKLYEAKKKELVLIIEDLDKVPIQAADEIFIENPAPLVDLECKAIYTAPIWLFFNPRAAILDAYFRKVKLPMIKVMDKDKAKNLEGYKTIRDILDRRFSRNLIHEDALDLLIEKTGGVLRHLFEVLDRAAPRAVQAAKRGNQPDKITKENIRQGLNSWKSELVARIGTHGLPDEYKDVTVEKMYECLRLLDPKPRMLKSDKVAVLLLQAHAVIEYNGEGWHCVHPLVSEHLQSE